MKEQKQRKNEEGITLIALVVTIIILLILAGVTLGTVLSNGGLIDKTKEAIGEHEKAQEKEEEELDKVAGMMKNLIDGLGSTGGTTPVTPPTPPSGGTGSSEVAEDLKEYQGKYVDIGLDVAGTEATTDDWELFYATGDRIFLIAADYVPVTKLTSWGVLGSNGFTSYNDYVVYWSSYPTSFMTLPEEPANFLELVMHTKYDLNAHNSGSYYNSWATSQLLNTTLWSGIKTAAEKRDYIDFVIGGPTLEMWCKAWNIAIEGDTTNGFVTFDDDPQPSSYGYKVKTAGTTSAYGAYMNGGGKPSSAQISALSTTYKTFFPHTDAWGNSWNGCYGYWLASPSTSNYSYLMFVECDGSVRASGVDRPSYGVRPVVSLQSGVQITETAEESNIYNVNR